MWRELRLLAKGQGDTGAEWRARWKASTKTGSPLFEGVTTDWNINQVALVWWSSFYDSIYEHPERPEQKIIDNDDLLDKWVEDQAKKAEQRSRKNSKGYGGTKSALDHDEVITFDDFEDEWDEFEEEEINEEY